MSLTASMRLALAMRRTKLAATLERVLLKEVKDPNLVRSAMKELYAARIPLVIDDSVKGMAQLMKTLTKTAYVPARRPKGYAHLFGQAKRELSADPIRRKYLQELDELRGYVRSTAFDEMIKTDGGRVLAGTQAMQLFHSLDITVVTRYGDLTRETYTFNRICRKLYPGDFPGLRVDAQHVIEQRFYDKFVKDWKLLDWLSKRDMAASPVMYEWHILNPKSVEKWRFENARMGKGKVRYKDPPEAGALGYLPKAGVDSEELNSLTDTLEERIKIGNMKTVEQLLDAYITVYEQPSKSGKGVNPYQPFLEVTRAIKQALAAAKDKAAKAAKSGKP